MLDTTFTLWQWCIHLQLFESYSSCLAYTDIMISGRFATQVLPVVAEAQRVTWVLSAGSRSWQTR